MSNPTLAIIGFGQLGQLAAKHLAPHADVCAYDPADRSAAANAMNIPLVPLPQAAAASIVVLAVPTQAMRATLTALAPHLKEGALVADTCSVKTLPAQWMLELLPPHVDIIATHPLFGPQSAAEGITDLKVVTCPLRLPAARYQRITHFLQDTLKLLVIDTTPEAHDADMAYVQALTHLIGRALAGTTPPSTPLATQSYQQLLNLCHLIEHDTEELFTALHTFNPQAAPVRQTFSNSLQALLNKLGT
ncbi:MAG: prephenate dehydrogenase [Pseudomonadaceae bacterium]|nr:prephenate dehydrogenase [Pseudomonadaceae bacterium]